MCTTRHGATRSGRSAEFELSLTAQFMNVKLEGANYNLLVCEVGVVFWAAVALALFG
jgi:hypothetical protein